MLSELGEYDRAIDDYTQAIALEEANAQAHYQRGMACENTDEFNRAIRDLDRAISLDPTTAPAYVARGMIHLASGQPQRALDDLDSVHTTGHAGRLGLR